MNIPVKYWKLAQENPGRYEHEVIVAPETLRKQGLTKYRSKVTPSGDVLRFAFPPGRRRKGSGKLQAILHKQNPAPKVYGYYNYMILQEGALWKVIDQLGRLVGRVDSIAAAKKLIDECWREKGRSLAGKNPGKEYTDEFSGFVNQLYAAAMMQTGGDKEKSQVLVDAYLHAMFDRELIASRPERAQRAQRNPKMVKIYNRILAIYASKAGLPHKCDAKCKALKHVYRHDFKKAACIYGLPNGNFLGGRI